MNSHPITRAAQDWMQADPEAHNRTRTQAMLEAGDLEGLKACFGQRLTFGTAGLRGPLGPGPGCMNRGVVRGVATALTHWLSDRDGPVVIAFDGRHGSRAFAEESACVLADAGRRVFLYEDVCPTPELAHAVTALMCAAGIMVTASHNPPQDNGYKVYDADGAQILPPAASAIADAWQPGIPDAPSTLEQARQTGRIQPVPPEVGDAWMSGLMTLRVHPTTASIRVVYTAMHGVGSDRVHEALRRAGHQDVHTVLEQDRPNGDFPTVSFPNPEEPGALDLAMARADDVGADLIVANDPDADRLAVSVRTSAGWRQLSGNEVGWLLADDLLEHGPQDASRLVATTIVSSAMLQRIADHHGATWTETLTGFKWLGHAAMRFEATGGRFVLGYEEALGYCAGSFTRDKDGVGAVMLLVDLAAWCRTRGETLLDRLDALHRRHGLHAARQHSIRMAGLDGKDRIDAAMQRLRTAPPAEIGGLAVSASRDLLNDADSDLPRSNVLAFDLAEGGRVLARPSGTEPKLKLYFEVVLPVGPSDPMDAVQQRAEAQLNALVADMLAQAGLD